MRDSDQAKDLPPISGQVVFDHVTFAYNQDKVVLNDVSLHVKPGQTVALVGETGAGKTTIVNLISRFYDVTKGSVKIDGYDIRDVKLDSLRTQMSVMQQDSFTFSGTIMENIRYGRLNASDEEVSSPPRSGRRGRAYYADAKSYKPASERGPLVHGPCQLVTLPARQRSTQRFYSGRRPPPTIPRPSLNQRRRYPAKTVP